MLENYCINSFGKCSKTVFFFKTVPEENKIRLLNIKVNNEETSTVIEYPPPKNVILASPP